MKKKVLIVFLCTMLFSALFFAETAFASDHAINSATVINLSDAGYADGDTIVITTADQVEIQNGEGKNISIRCFVDSADIVINNLNIISGNYGIFFMSGENNKLTLKGTNYIQSGNQYPGIWVSAGRSLYIYGDTDTAELEVYGSGGSPGIGNDIGSPVNSGLIIIESGIIEAYGGPDGGAGIGSAKKNGDGYVTINGGTVYAFATEGAAAIGGGAGGETVGNIPIYSNGYVNITGGEVFAVSDIGAGIGGGDYGGGGYVNITGGIVEAYGGISGAGIGSGYGNLFDASTVGGYSEINIENAQVYAEGGEYAAGIGGGHFASAYVKIKSGTVEAYGGDNGAGIGGGCEGFGEVYIEGGAVHAYGGNEGYDLYQGGAGIGGGYMADGHVEISSGTVEAYGGTSSAGIGGGAGGEFDVGDGVVIITGGDIYAEGGEYGAGIGGGDFGGSGYVSISNSKIEAYGGDSAAGIGGGYGEYFDMSLGGGNGEVSIISSEVYAEGGEYAAGIGGGFEGYGDIEITGGTVDAYAGIYGAGIGGGYENNGTVLINSGTVNALSISYGAGIGGGTAGKGIVTINGGTINATAGYDAAGIGGGVEGGCEIIINGGTIKTFAVEGSEAGIGTGPGNTDGGSIVINGGTIIARGGKESEQSAAGIGTGCEGSLDSITITGGEIYAIGGDDDTCDDIGAGWDGSITSVTIEGTASVFMMYDRICYETGILNLTVPHQHVDSETVTDNKAYGFTKFPDEFNTYTGYGYLLSVDVNFNHNWGTVPASDTVQTYFNGLLNEPAAPLRGGYVFNGWHIDALGAQPWYFDSYPVITSLTLYADWIAEGTFRGNLGGYLYYHDHSPAGGCLLTLESSPVTVAANAEGAFSYGSVYFVNHKLYVHNPAGDLIKVYSISFTPGSAPGSSVNEALGSINIIYTNTTTGISIPLIMNEPQDDVTLAGSITISDLQTDPAMNPLTGDSTNYFYIFAVPSALLLLAAAWLIIKKLKVQNADKQ